MPDIVVPLKVALAALDSGVVDTTLREARIELARMARFSAHITHPRGNRRWHDWVMHVEDGVLHGICPVGAD